MKPSEYCLLATSFVGGYIYIYIYIYVYQSNFLWRHPMTMVYGVLLCFVYKGILSQYRKRKEGGDTQKHFAKNLYQMTQLATYL